MNRWSLLYCTSCVGALLALSGCGKSEPAQPAPAPTGSAAVAADVQALPVDAAKLAADRKSVV